MSLNRLFYYFCPRNLPYLNYYLSLLEVLVDMWNFADDVDNDCMDYMAYDVASLQNYLYMFDRHSLAANAC